MFAFGTPDIRQLAETTGLPGAALKLMTFGQRPESFLQALDKAKRGSDAVSLLAHGMPEQSSVRWATLSVRSVPACWSDEIAKEALTAAETWIRTPAELTRERASMTIGRHSFEMPAAAAIRFAAVVEPNRATELYQRFLETGVKIAQDKIRMPG